MATDLDNKACGGKPKTRLHDMVIHSLAFVDRGANNKRWLIAKRAEAPAPAEPIAAPAPDAASAPVATAAAAPEPPNPPPAAPDQAELEKGRRLAQERLARMWSAFNSMADVLKDLVAEVTAPPPPRPTPEPAGEPTGLEIAMGELAKRQRAHEEELAKLRKIRGSSTAIPVEGTPPAPAPFAWPADMNDLRKDPRFRRGK